MMRFLWPLLAFALIVSVLAYGLYGSTSRNAANQVLLQSPLLGKPAPVYLLPDLLAESAMFNSELFRNEWQLVNVWGTWCAECRVEHAQLLAIKAAGGVKLIGINWKDDDVAARRWLMELGDPYHRVAADRDGRVAIDWGVYAAPESFLVDPAGIVCRKRLGAMTAEIWREQFLPLLSQSACPAAP